MIGSLNFGPFQRLQAIWRFVDEEARRRKALEKAFEKVYGPRTEKSFQMQQAAQRKKRRNRP